MKKSIPSRKLRITLGSAPVLAALALTAVSCGERNTYVKPPPPEVEVVSPIIGEVDVPRESPATTRAFARAEIRARVQGFLKQPDFEPGTFVKAGQVLYTIEPEEFQAAVARAQGELDAAEAALGIAQTNYDKRNAASKSGGVSKIDVAAALAERDAAKANVDIMTAALADANRSLDYTEVKSPLDGRVSQTLVDIGNLVGADGPTLLTSVVQEDPIYVDFEGSERAILEYLPRRPDKDGSGYDEEFKSLEVRLTLSDGTPYPKTGHLDFLDNEVDPDTGTIRARAIFENPDGALASGMFVRISMDDTLPNAIQIPGVAIQRDLGGAYVIVVGENNVAERRPIKESRFVKGDTSILESGLSTEDRVIVSNLQRARPGTTVRVVESASGEAASVGEAPASGNSKPDAKGQETPADEQAPDPTGQAADADQKP